MKWIASLFMVTLMQHKYSDCKLKRILRTILSFLFPVLCVFRVTLLHLGFHHSVSPDFFSFSISVQGWGSTCWVNSYKLTHSSLCCRPGRVRTRRQSSGSVGGPSTPVADSRGRSRAKVVSQSQRMYLTHARLSTP